MKLPITFVVPLFLCFSIFGSGRAIDLESDGGKVVQIHTGKNRAKREVRPVTFELDGIDYSFNFELSKRRVVSRDIPVWLVKSRPGHSPNYTYELVPDTERILSKGHFYVDNAKKAVAFVRYDEENRDIIYDGVFGENEKVHLIESLSETQKYKLQRSRQQGNLRGNHIVRKAPKRKSYFLSDGVEATRSQRSDPLNEKSDKPLDVLYPKLLVVVDNDLFKYHNSDIDTLVRYVATFWNKVDQKYVELGSPDIQLLVTGIIIADDKTALSYVHNARLDEKEFGKNRAHIPYMYEFMRMHFHYNFSSDVDFQNYDAAVLMTALDTGVIAGISSLGKICGDWYNDMVVKDEGWFTGIHTASHELAHALSVEHDSYKTPGECQSHDNNKGVSVMSPVGDSGDYFFWSECTKKYLKNFTTLKAAECLATRHRERHYDEDNDF